MFSLTPNLKKAIATVAAAVAGAAFPAFVSAVLPLVHNTLAQSILSALVASVALHVKAPGSAA